MQKHDHFDVIVIGAGSMGAPACFYLASKGARVLGVDQFHIPHELGAHGGQTRIIRKAYFEHPDYVPLLQKAYENWMQLEQQTGEQVYYKTGLLYAGPPESAMLKGVRHASSAYGIPIREMSRAGNVGPHPSFPFPAAFDCLFEPDAGFLLPEKSIRLYKKSAEDAGAVFKTNTKVLGWKDLGSQFAVYTTGGVFFSEKLVFTSGAWTARLLPSLPVALHVTRQVLAWVTPVHAGSVSLGQLPCWMVADVDIPGCFYGFPLLPSDQFEGPRGCKLAWHYPGTTCDPEMVDRTVSAEEENILIRFLDKYFPGMYVRTSQLKTCLYTNSPDEHFIIDFLPGYENRIVLGAGFSGHGYKFASYLGEILAEMSLTQNAPASCAFLSLQRFKT